MKASLSERYEAVKKSLESYKGAIETTVKELFDKETIDGERVREIIRSFEEENGMETRLVPLESELD